MLKVRLECVNILQLLNGMGTVRRDLGLLEGIHQAGILFKTKWETNMVLKSIGVHFGQTTTKMVFRIAFLGPHHQLVSIGLKL